MESIAGGAAVKTMETKEEKAKTVSQIIEEVKNEICDKYCRYQTIYDEDDEDELTEMMEKICFNCPLDRL